MSHFVVGVILPADTAESDIHETVDRLLAPYDESTRVERYKVVQDADEIDRMARHYDIPPTDLVSLAAKLQDWIGLEGGVEDGKLFTWNTYNPQSKWDWFVIGGRWHGWLTGKNRDHYIEAVNRGDTWAADIQYGKVDTRNANYCRVSQIKIESPPFALVTPDGIWHEKGKMGWWGSVSVHHSPEEQAELARITAQVHARYAEIGNHDTAWKDPAFLELQEQRNAILQLADERARHDWGMRAAEILTKHREPVDHLIVAVDCHI